MLTRDRGLALTWPPLSPKLQLMRAAVVVVVVVGVVGVVVVVVGGGGGGCYWR